METDLNETAVRFLLGKMTEEEQSEVEQDFFRDPKAFEDILIAENSLTDAYVLNRLSKDDRLLFEQRLLISPRQRQRALFAGTLLTYASQQPVDDPSLFPSEGELAKKLSRLFSFRPMLSYSFAATILLLTVLAFWFVVIDSNRPVEDNLVTSNVPSNSEVALAPNNGSRELEQPIKELNLDNSSNSDPAEVTGSTKNETIPRSVANTPVPKTNSRAILATIVLSAGSTRDTDLGKAYRVPHGNGLVDLKLNFGGSDHSLYFAVLETADGQQIWRGKVAGLGGKDDVKVASISVPSRKLGKGDYVVSLKGRKENGTYEPVAEYTFTLNR